LLQEIPSENSTNIHSYSNKAYGCDLYDNDSINCDIINLDYIKTNNLVYTVNPLLNFATFDSEYPCGFEGLD
jgi:hypothetical protein